MLERIPAQVRDDYDCEILVVDDASEDRTFALGREYQQAHPEIRMTVLRNELNQGYGGNQKIGYTFAIEHGFDVVVLLHGDGQYAPEEMPRLLAPLRDGEADAVFGSRMMTAFGALRGGMPLYKYVGNRVLTTMQNALLRHAPQRVPQRLPRLLGVGAAPDPLRAELRRLPLRHRDHHPAAQRRAADRRGADPHATTATRSATSTASGTPRTSR